MTEEIRLLRAINRKLWWILIIVILIALATK
jgi:hypothetical protein